MSATEESQPNDRPWHHRACSFLAVAGLLALLGIGSSEAAVKASFSPVDTVITRCPTAAEVAQINADIPIDFGADPTAGTLVCSAASGSADLTLLQKRVYQAFTIMREVRFTRPLPWTSESLYDWFVGTVKGVKFIASTELEGGNGFCCSPEGVVNIVYPGLNELKLNRWEQTLEKNSRGFLGSAFFLISTLVHETRHIEVGAHTCGMDDKTYGEMGASAVSPPYLRMWLALYSGRFMDAPGRNPSYYREQLFFGDNYKVTCAPQAHLTIKVGGTPFKNDEGGFYTYGVRTAPVRSGGVLAYRITARNRGPGAVPDAYVYSFIPRGTRLIGTPAGCEQVAAAGGSSVGCKLGALGAKSAKRVTLRFRVKARAGATLTNQPVRGVTGGGPRSLGTAVIGFAYDPKLRYDAYLLVLTKVVP